MEGLKPSVVRQGSALRALFSHALCAILFSPSITPCKTIAALGASPVLQKFIWCTAEAVRVDRTACSCTRAPRGIPRTQATSSGNAHAVGERFGRTRLGGVNTRLALSRPDLDPIVPRVKIFAGENRNRAAVRHRDSAGGLAGHGDHRTIGEIVPTMLKSCLQS